MKDVPFFPNTADDTHCYQAALKIVLKHFLPDKNYSFDKLGEFTAKKEGLWAWPTQGIINLHKLGFDIVDIDSFDGQQFVEKGGDYLIAKYGKEVGEAQIAHSDLKQEQRLWKEYASYNIHQTGLPEINDIKQFIDKGYLVISLLNSNMLNNKPGYTGHFVVIFGHNANGFFLHDPGIPPEPNRFVLYEDFIRAWAYPTADSKNLFAVKYKEG